MTLSPSAAAHAHSREVRIRQNAALRRFHRPLGLFPAHSETALAQEAADPAMIDDGSAARELKVEILGPIRVRYGSREVDLARRQQRILLGVLALEANRLVLRERLSSLVWGQGKPERADGILRTRISETRSALALAADSTPECALETHGAGYLLRIADGNVDARVFEADVRRSRTQPLELAAATLRGALDLWKGPAFGGSDADGIRSISDVLESGRLAALEELFEIELAIGRHNEIVDEISAARTANPARERLVLHLMTAQYRAGRVGDSLQTFDQWRRWLADELGSDPGPEVRSLQLAILRNDVAAYDRRSAQDRSPHRRQIAQQRW